MTDTPHVLLAHHLKTLKLPTFLREYDKVARQCAAEGVDYPRYLLRLAELELIDRERRMVERRIKAAKFPTVKSLDSFDFAAFPSLNKALVMELARSEYVERRENIIAVGNSETHIGLGLGLAACQKGLSVDFTTAAALVHELIEARDEKRLHRLQRQCAAYKLLIVDELGYVPLSQTGAELLFLQPALTLVTPLGHRTPATIIRIVWLDSAHREFGLNSRPSRKATAAFVTRAVPPAGMPAVSPGTSQIVRASGMRSDNPGPRKRMNDRRSLIRYSARSSGRFLVARMNRR